MRVFVTGGTGYIGQGLVARLLEDGHTVHLLVHSRIPGQLAAHERVQVFQGDLMDTQTLRQGVEGCAQVYHTAAYARVYARDLRTYYRTNVHGTKNVLDAAIDAGVQRLVYTSTAGVLGPAQSGPVTEDTVRITGFSNDYESSKHLAEGMALSYTRKGLEVVTVLPTKVYGPGRWSESNAATLLVKRYIEGRWRIVPGTGRTLYNFVLVDDVVEGHILAMKHGRSGERYLLGGENASFRTFFNQVAELSGKRYRMVPAPMALMLAVAAFQELKPLFGKEPRITRPWVRKYSQDTHCSCDKAINELGYCPTPLVEGLRKTIEWLKHSQHTHRK